MSKFIPSALVSRIDQFIQSHSSGPLQTETADYLVRLQNEVGRSAGPDRLRERILAEAYNQRAGNRLRAYRPGDAEPLSDQIFLLISLAIWIIFVPLGFIIYQIIKRIRRTGRLQLEGVPS